MPSAAERLRHVTLKVRRASEHLASVGLELRTFFETKPYTVATKHHPDSRKLIYYVDRTEPIPDSVSLAAGDVIQNLVTGLDHLAYQLVSSDTGDNPPNPHGIYFPIGDDLANYDKKKKVQLQGAQQATFNAIDSLKPYKGGNDSLWVLHTLNNLEKHRLLLTVGSRAAGVHLGQLLASLDDGFPPAGAKASLEGINLYLNPGDKGFPLASGFELYIGKVDEAPNPEQKFAFDVALNEPGVVDARPLLALLKELLTIAEQTVAELAPLLK